MKVLFLAPQPFFQDRGTPIAVRLALEVLADRFASEDNDSKGRKTGNRIDLLTYHEGRDVPLPFVKHYRIPAPRWLSRVGPGISVKKILCDFIFFFMTVRLILLNRKEPYDLIHAVEESVFIAALIRKVWGVPYIYDMDSSLALQVVEKIPFLGFLSPVLEMFERYAVRHSAAVVPVCDALEAIARKHGSQHTQILRDISLLDRSVPVSPEPDLRSEAELGSSEIIALYVGNLEKYQGIDLLLEGFAAVAKKVPLLHVVIIGGTDRHIEQYRAKAKVCSLINRVHFLGPRSSSTLSSYLPQADILLSPRTMGNNTPMKIYSYLHARVPTLATALPTHTQVLTPSVAQLAAPNSKDFGEALTRLAADESLRKQIAQNAWELAEERYTFSTFSRDLNRLYDRIGAELFPAREQPLKVASSV